MASENMQKAIRLIVRTTMSQKEIAKEIGINEATISKWKQRDDFDVIRQQEERLFLGDLAAPAMRTMQNLLNAKSELVRYNAASDILNRTGYKPVDKAEITQRSIEITVGEYNEEH